VNRTIEVQQKPSTPKIKPKSQKKTFEQANQPVTLNFHQPTSEPPISNLKIVHQPQTIETISHNRYKDDLKQRMNQFFDKVQQMPRHPTSNSKEVESLQRIII